jgi:hypothetical protein
MRIEDVRTPLLISLLLLATVAGPGLARSPAGADEPGRLLHLGHRAGVHHSVRVVDPLTLEPRSRPIRGFRHVYGGSLSPDGRRLARGTGWGDSRIQVINLARWREERVITLGGRGEVLVEWPTARRLIAVVGAPHERQELVVVDPATGAVTSRRAISGLVLQRVPIDGGLALLVAPERRAGPARLVLADASGSFRSLVLDRIAAGFNVTARRRASYRNPTVAVNPAGRRAFVVAAGERLVAEVDLASGRVSYREPAPLPGAPPYARAAKGNMRIWAREAAWFGEHSIAVTGYDGYPRRRGARFPPPIEPYGVRLIDTTDWTIRTLHKDTMQMYVAADRLLAHGTTWHARSRRSSSTGLFAFDDAERLAFARFPGQEVTPIGTHGNLAYVWVRQDRALHVLDVRDGRTLRRMPARARDVPVLVSTAP